MLKAAQEVIGRLLAGKVFASNDELYLFLVLLVANVFAWAMHLLLLVIMLALGVPLLAGVNAVSICIYTGAGALLIKKRTFALTGFIVAAEVMAYTLFTSFYIGSGSCVILYYFVLLLMQLTIPYAGTKARVAVSAATWLALLATLFAGWYVPPLHPLPGGEKTMTLFNANLAFFGIIIELSIHNVLRQVIAGYNTARMNEYKSKANTDSLTGLNNRWYAEKFFAGLRANGRRWCVAMLDIDDFKNINDTMGHPVGDEVLRGLADELRANLRRTDVLFRWGGEEFLLFLADVDLLVAAEILDKLRATIARRPVRVAGTNIAFTVTIGVAALDPEDIAGCIALCDERMYQGKGQGKNRVVWGAADCPPVCRPAQIAVDNAPPRRLE